jgi:putative sterol carrier protein
MTDATTAFFQDLGARGHEPLLEKATGTMRFDLSNGKRTRWLVTIEKGDVKVSQRNSQADCVASADKRVFERIVKGEMNAMAAVLRGLIHVDGDPASFVLFQRLFPGPPGATRRPPSTRSTRTKR